MLLFRVFFALTTAVSRPRAVMAINLVYFAAKIPLNALFIYGALGAPSSAVRAVRSQLRSRAG